MAIESSMEPLRAEWARKGFPCLVYRNPVGIWCGYIGLPKNHIWFKRNYEDIKPYGIQLEFSGGTDEFRYSESLEYLWWLGVDSRSFDLAKMVLAEKNLLSFSDLLGTFVDLQGNWEDFKGSNEVLFVISMVEKLADNADMVHFLGEGAYNELQLVKEVNGV